MKVAKLTKVGRIGSALRCVQNGGYPGVLSVRDAKKNLRITVTEEQSKNSMPKNHRHCALAQACDAAMPIEGVIVSKSGRVYIVDSPTTAVRFIGGMDITRQIKSFDKGHGFAAGEYVLHVPNKHRALGSPTKAGKYDGSRSTFKRRTYKIDNEVRASLRDGRRIIV